MPHWNRLFCFVMGSKKWQQLAAIPLQHKAECNQVLKKTCIAIQPTLTEFPSDQPQKIQARTLSQ